MKHNPQGTHLKLNFLNSLGNAEHKAGSQPYPAELNPNARLAVED
jgi:hypothetical protein